jgi:phospholipid transport system substrate-binding protein
LTDVTVACGLFLAVLFAFVAPARAADGPSASPASRIEAFYAVLLETMKQAEELGIQGRYGKLKPAIEQVYDLPGMTSLAVGSSWAGMTPQQHAGLIEAFTHMTVANYARAFNGYSGERFDVDPNVQTRDAMRIVRTKLIQQDKEPVALGYLMRQSGSDWKIIDVYYEGNISQLAARRSEFSATLKSGGADALQQKLRELGDRLMTGA